MSTRTINAAMALRNPYRRLLNTRQSYRIVQYVRDHKSWRVIAIWKMGDEWYIEFDIRADVPTEAAWIKYWKSNDRYDYGFDHYN